METLKLIKESVVHYYKNSNDSYKPIGAINKCKTMKALHNCLLKTSGDDLEHIAYIYLKVLENLTKDTRNI